MIYVSIEDLPHMNDSDANKIEGVLPSADTITILLRAEGKEAIPFGVSPVRLCHLSRQKLSAYLMLIQNGLVSQLRAAYCRQQNLLPDKVRFTMDGEEMQPDQTLKVSFQEAV